MNYISEMINKISLDMLKDLWIAVGIVAIFIIFRSTMSSFILRILKPKKENSKQIKQSAFYMPLRSFFGFLGIYLAILFLREPFSINDNVMEWVTKIFKIVVIVSTAAGIANSITMKSKLAKRIKDKSEKAVQDSAIEFSLKIIRTIIYIIAGFLCLTVLEFNLNGLVAGLGIGGVILTLAAQDTAKNLFGGVVILFDKPFIVGDYIEFGGYEGTVEDITFRCTKVRTLQNSVLHIPNAIVTNSTLINCTQMQKRRFETVLKIEQNASLDKVNKLKENIEKLLKEHSRVIKDSEVVKFESICENGMNILIYAYIDEVAYDPFLEIKEDINYKIMQLIKEENIVLTNSITKAK